jgi:hypothetical protein
MADNGGFPAGFDAVSKPAPSAAPASGGFPEGFAVTKDAPTPGYPLRGVPEEPTTPRPDALDPLRAGRLLIGLEEPQGWGDYALMAGASIPLTMAGGMGAEALAARLGAPALLARAAPMVGRVAASAGLGGIRGANQGTGAVYGAMIDAIVSGLTEGAVSAGANLGIEKPVKLGLKEWGAPARGFEWATKAPEKALDLLSSRLPPGRWLNVPSLSGQPMTAQEAVKALSKTEGLAYRQARAEIAHEMSRLDAQRVTGPRPLAGPIFKEATAKQRFPPSDFARAAQGIYEGSGSNVGRSAIDALTTAQPTTGVPLGLFALPSAVSRHLPGGEQLMDDEEMSYRRR